MALRDIEGWDQFSVSSDGVGYADDRDHGWTFSTTTGVGCSNGYSGGTAVYLTTSNNLYFYKIYDQQPIWILGFWFFTPTSFSAADVLVCGFGDNGAGVNQAALLINSGILKFSRNAHTVILETGTTTLNTGTWYHIQVKLLIGNSGTWEVRLREAGGSEWVELQGSGDTQNSANAYADLVAFYNYPTGGGNANLHTFDHIWICDGTGTIRNDFLGQLLVKTQVPDAAGTYTQFTPSTGSNWSNVDERTWTHQPTDNDYNYSTTSGHKDGFQMGQLNYSGTVYGIKVSVRWRVTSGAGSMKTLLRIDGTDYNGSAVSGDTEYRLTSTYDSQALYYKNPKTLNDWTIADINAGEFGCQNNVGTVETRIAQVYIQVLGEFAPPVSTEHNYGFWG